MKLTWRSALMIGLLVEFHLTHVYFMPKLPLLLWLSGELMLGFCVGNIMIQWECYHLDCEDRKAGPYTIIQPREDV
jgi:hypothetical protein